MKTTVELPDAICRQAKAEAAQRGRKLKDLTEEGLRLVIDAPPHTAGRRDLAGLMEQARGVIESDIPDLASNPDHLNGFGCNASDH